MGLKRLGTDCGKEKPNLRSWVEEICNQNGVTSDESWCQIRHDSMIGKGSTQLFIQQYKVNGDALWRWFTKRLPDTGKSSVYICMGEMKKPRLGSD